MTYAAWIRDGLKKTNRTQRELAEVLRLHPSAVAKILSGDRVLKAEELPIIAKFIGQAVPGGAGSDDAVRELEEENAWLKSQLADCLLREMMLKRRQA